MYFHDREDHAHLLRQIAISTQSRGPNGLDMETLTEVLECSPESGLTESVEQSVPHPVPQAEVLHSIYVADTCTLQN